MSVRCLCDKTKLLTPYPAVTGALSSTPESPGGPVVVIHIDSRDAHTIGKAMQSHLHKILAAAVNHELTASVIKDRLQVYKVRLL